MGPGDLSSVRLIQACLLVCRTAVKSCTWGVEFYWGIGRRIFGFMVAAPDPSAFAKVAAAAADMGAKPQRESPKLLSNTHCPLSSPGLPCRDPKLSAWGVLPRMQTPVSFPTTCAAPEPAGTAEVHRNPSKSLKAPEPSANALPICPRGYLPPASDLLFNRRFSGCGAQAFR